MDHLSFGVLRRVGFAFAVSMLCGQSLRAQVTLPYSCDFEEAQGFQKGDLNGVNGWQVFTGAAAVVDTDAFSGTRSVELGAGASAVVTQSFAQLVSSNVVFVDFYAKPSATSDILTSSVFDVESSRAAFLKVGDEGQVLALNGDGNGGGAWFNTGLSGILTNTNQSPNWIRFTFRQDYSSKKWDLYLNGAMAAHGLGFKNATANAFSILGLQGALGAASYFDYLYVGAENPLFVDADQDGLPDEWEQSYFGTLSYSGTDDPALTGRTLAQSFQQNLSPTESSSPSIPAAGLRLWLQADAIVGSGYVATWPDSSGAGNDGVQTTAAAQPTVVEAAQNGHRVVHFEGTSWLDCPDVMQETSAGEIIAVVKVGTKLDAPNSAWQFGVGEGTGYLNETAFDDFGTGDIDSFPGAPSSTVTQYHIHNVSAEQGTWTQRINGVETHLRTGEWPAFRTDPIIGGSRAVSAGFVGDIAEVIVYNRVLTAVEREAVCAYLLTKYAVPGIVQPTAPTGLAVAARGPTELLVQWTTALSDLGAVATVERQIGTGDFTVVAEQAGIVSYLDTELIPGESYTYRVKLRGLAGSSGYSESVTQSTPLSGPELPDAGLCLWLKADAGTSIEAAGKVAGWLDQSGLNHGAAQSNAAAQPTLVENQLNGLPVLRFDGTNYLDLPDVIRGGTTAEIIAVVKLEDNPAIRNTLWQFGVGTGTGRLDNDSFDDFGTGDGDDFPGADPATMAQYHLHNVSATDGLWVQRVNGVETHRREGEYTAFASAPVVGGSTNHDSPLKGDIAELIVYDHVLSDTERNAVGAYVMQKYGLAVANGGGETDTDGDGMPDAWELAHGLNPLVNDANADPDEDGVDNVIEYKLGRDPHAGMVTNDPTVDLHVVYPR